ncbi:methyl-viologen-reducing hydrogenase subunit delta [Candidatus Bathyarchaeota archaeon RBG_16_48_13]|nr:MAG: methyl-viologen-reducing hydrogenase subunit delta [Candidatus Bathyarchaeota archaeon RBG_16_48_13]
MAVDEFQPKILGFLCNWCSYAGADLAGISRMQYPPNLRIIRVMCSGRIDPAFVLEAFKSGADGVLVAGCHLPSDCHYVSGNFKTYRRIAALRKLLQQLGFEPQRLRVEWVSASEGARFADVVKEMTDEIKRLGPNPLTKTGGEFAGSSLRELERVASRVTSTSQA